MLFGDSVDTREYCSEKSLKVEPISPPGVTWIFTISLKTYPVVTSEMGVSTSDVTQGETVRHTFGGETTLPPASSQ